MPFKQAWYIEDRIVKVELYGDLTAEEIAESFMVSGEFLIEAGEHRIHFIHDWAQIKSYPTNLHDIHHLLNSSMSGVSDNLGWVVIYGAETKLLRFIGDLTFQRFQIRTHKTDDFDSALAFLQQQDPSLKTAISQKPLMDVTWYLPGHIIYCHDLIDPDAMMQRNLNAYALLNAEGKPPFVHLLIDFTSTDSPDYNVNIRNIMRRSRHSPEFEAARDQLIQHPLFGWVVVFGIKDANLNVGGKINAMRTNYKRKDVESLNEALTFIKQVDPHVAQLLNSMDGT